MSLHGAGTPIKLSQLNQEFQVDPATQRSMGSRGADILVNSNSHSNRSMSQFYGTAASKYISGSSYNITSAFPLTSGDAVYLDVNTTGGWCNADRQSYRLTLVYGTSSSGSWNGGNGGKNDYYSYSFDGTTLSISGYYCCASTNFGWVSYSVRRIIFLGQGYSPATTQLGISQSSYLNSSYYLDTVY